jgi:endonuclease YncB( thermonuclease family)
MLRFPCPPRLLAGLLTGLLALAIAGPARAGSGRDFGRAEAVVVRVCDGDTVVVDIPAYPDVIGKAVRVRLAGVDAPELRAADPVEREAARRAKAALEALLPPGAPVVLTGIRRDKYFRLDAAIRVGDRDAAAALGLPPSPRPGP